MKEVFVTELNRLHCTSYNHCCFAPLRVFLKFSVQLIETLLDANQKFQP